MCICWRVTYSPYFQYKLTLLKLSRVCSLWCHLTYLLSLSLQLHFRVQVQKQFKIQKWDYCKK